MRSEKGFIFRLKLLNLYKNCLLDTGSSANLISLTTANSLGINKFTPTSIICRGVNDQCLQVFGTVVLPVFFSEYISFNVSFIVVGSLPKKLDFILGEKFMHDHSCKLDHVYDDVFALKVKILDSAFVSEESLIDQHYFSVSDGSCSAEQGSSSTISNNENKRTVAVGLKATLTPTALQPAKFIIKSKETQMPLGESVLIRRYDDFLSNSLCIDDQICTVDDSRILTVYIANFSDKNIDVSKRLKLEVIPWKDIKDYCYAVSDECRMKFEPLRDGLEDKTSDEVKAALPTFKVISNKEKIAEIKSHINSQNLDAVTMTRLTNLLHDYIDVLYVDGDKLGQADCVEHHIELEGNAQPVFTRQYKLPEKYKAEVDRQISDLVKHNLIEESESPWNSPCFVVKQKDKLRIVIDYRKLNSVSKSSRYPIPDIGSVLSNLGGHKYFSVLDLASGFHQIKLSEKSRDLSTFSTDKASFRWKVLPFGLKNGPASCVRLMNNVLGDLQPKISIAYMDDLIVFSDSIEEHLTNLGLIFDKMRKHNLKFKLKKCSFLKDEVDFLGHVISRNGIEANPSKLDAISKTSPPRDANQVKSFLGLINYYRSFIPDCATMTEPIVRLTRKCERFKWGAEQNESFQKIKSALSEKIILAHPALNKPFILFTDASSVGTGCALCQLSDDGTIRPIKFSSKCLNKAERNYSTFDRELLAIIHGLRSNRQLILANKVHIYSDHRPLKYILSLKEPRGRLARWLSELLEYDLSFEYVPGSENVLADFLSRFPVGVSSESMMVSQISNSTFSLDEVKLAQETDRQCIGIKRKLRGPLKKRPKIYKCIQGLLCYTRFAEPIPVMPECLRDSAIRIAHSTNLAGHGGFHSTRQRLLAFCFWPGYESDISNFIKNCHLCNTWKQNRKQVHPMGKAESARYPLHVVHVDLVGPLDRSQKGNRWIMSVVDSFTRHLETIALPTKSADDVANGLVNGYFSKHGFPIKLVMDRGKEFLNSVLKQVANLCNINLHFICPATPQSNAKVERSHSSLMNKLRVMSETRPLFWDEFLPLATFAYNTQHHSSIDCSPFVAFYGREPIIPETIFKERKKYYGVQDFMSDLQDRLASVYEHIFKNSEDSFEKSKLIHDKRAKNFDLKIGQIVYLENRPEPFKCLKLQAKYTGPFKISRKIGPLVYEIEDDQTGKKSIQHVHRLRITNVGSKISKGEETRRLVNPEKTQQLSYPSDVSHNYNLRPRM